MTDFIARRAMSREGFDEFVPLLQWSALTDSGLALDGDDCRSLADSLVGAEGPIADRVAAWAASHGFDEGRSKDLVDLAVKVMARLNLRHYAEKAHNRLALREAFVPHRSIEDASHAGSLRLHRSPLSRRVPG